MVFGTEAAATSAGQRDQLLGRLGHRRSARLSVRERLTLARRITVIGVPKTLPSSQLSAQIEGELARFGSELEHDPPWVLGIQRTESSAAVDFPMCTVAHAALGLRISVPGNPEALTFVKPPDVPEMRDPPSSVTDAIQAAIDAGALAHEDIDDDAWESLHLVDPRVVLRMVQSLAPADGLAGAGGAALVERLDAAEAQWEEDARTREDEERVALSGRTGSQTTPTTEPDVFGVRRPFEARSRPRRPRPRLITPPTRTTPAAFIQYRGGSDPVSRQPSSTSHRHQQHHRLQQPGTKTAPDRPAAGALRG